MRGVQENIQYNDAINEAVLGWRNRVWARQAWFERRNAFACESQFIAFGEGFRDGYAGVAGGASGCVPALPPRKYWSWKYQTPEGQAKVAAWYAGYPHGARAAEEDGAANFQSIQVSHWIEAQYSPEFQSGICPNCPNDFHGEDMPTVPTDSNLPSPSRTPKPVVDPMSFYSPGTRINSAVQNSALQNSAALPVNFVTPDQVRSHEPPQFSIPRNPPDFVPSHIVSEAIGPNSLPNINVATSSSVYLQSPN